MNKKRKRRRKRRRRRWWKKRKEKENSNLLRIKLNTHILRIIFKPAKCKSHKI